MNPLFSPSFDDLENDIDFDDEPVRTPNAHAAVTAANALVYACPCKKCGGSGKFVGYTGRVIGPCFVCQGSGTQAFRTSPEQRAKARMQAAGRKERVAQNNVAGWCEANPEDAAWLKAKAGSFEFAGSMLQALERFGSLTERQHATVTRLRQQDAERTAQRAAQAAAQAAAAPAVDAARLEEAFGKAKDAGLKYPKITMGAIVIKPAGTASKNAGALYVTSEGNYLGKVMGGKFLRVRECSDEQAQVVADLVNDPAGAAKAYGLKTGRCCMCSRELTDPVSIANGIGPICAENFGF
jgi:hypothetical protein